MFISFLLCFPKQQRLVRVSSDDSEYKDLISTVSDLSILKKSHEK